MRKIDFIYFDLGQVVVDNDAAINKIATTQQIDSDRLTKFFDHNWKLVCRGKISPAQYLVRLKKEVGVKTKARDFVEFWSDLLEPIAETHELIKQLVKRFQVGVISNAEVGMFAALIRKGKIPKVAWSSVVISAEVGFIKPERQIYEIAQEKAGVPAKSIFCLDDKPENVQMAQSLGWQGLVFVKADVAGSLEKLRTTLSSDAIWVYNEGDEKNLRGNK